MMTSIKILKEPESVLLVGPRGPSVGVGKALLTCCSEDSPRRHPPGPPQTVTDAATGRGTEPPGADRETDRARRSGQNVVDTPESTCRAEAAHGWARGRKCALHSTVYKGQGGALGEEGAHTGVQPLPTPQLRVPASPARAGDMGFMEDSGPPTPPSGWVRDSLSSLCSPPRLHSGPTGGSTPPGFTGDHFPPPPGPTQSPPTDSTPHLSSPLCQTQHVGQEPFTHHLSTARIKPSEQAQRSQVTSSISQYLPPTVPEAPGRQLRQHACLAPPETLRLHTASLLQARLTACGPRSTAVSCLIHVLGASKRVGGCGTPVISERARNPEGQDRGLGATFTGGCHRAPPGPGKWHRWMGGDVQVRTSSRPQTELLG